MFSWKNKQLSELDRQKLFRNFGTYVILGMALFAIAFFGVCSPRDRMYGPKGSAAVVDGEAISSKEFRRNYYRWSERLRSQYGEAFDPTKVRLANMVMNQLIDQRVLSETAESAGIQATDDDILKFIKDQFKGENGTFSEQAFSGYLSSQGYTEATFAAEIRREITLQKLQEFLNMTTFVPTKEAEISYKLSSAKLDVDFLKFDLKDLKLSLPKTEIDAFVADAANKAKIEDYYKKNQHDFSKPAKVHARHILIAFKGARNASGEAANRSKEQAKTRADEILAKVRAPGADFATIAKEKTDEPSGKTKGGDLGFFTKDAMAKEFSDAAFALKPGEISGVVESPFGFHIIKVEGKQDAEEKSLADATPIIARKLLEREKAPAILATDAEKTLESLKAGKPVDGMIKEYGVSWQNTGPFAVDSKYIPKMGSDRELKDAVLSLKNVGKPYDKVLSSGDSRFVIRLKSRQDADMSKFDEKKIRELTMNETSTISNARYMALRQEARDKLEKKGKIWRSPEYLAVDAPRQQPKGGDSGPADGPEEN